MATSQWVTETPTAAHNMGTDLTNLWKNLQELQRIVETISNGTLGTTDTDNYKVDNLADDTVVTADIKDANVTAAKLAANAVETAKIKDANVTAAKLDVSAYPWLGYMNRAQFTYNGGATAYTVKVKPATYQVKDKFAYWASEITTNAISSPAANDWYYLYLDYSAITEGTAVTKDELIWSNTEPSWSNAYAGWYNGDDRCIFAVRTNAAPDNILEFFHDGDLVVFAGEITDRAQADLDDVWTDVTLTIPKFTNRAEVGFYTASQSDVNHSYLRWRTDGQTNTTGHTVHYTAATDSYSGSPLNTLTVITSAAKKIEIKQSISGDHQTAVKTQGWYFSIGT